MNYFGKQAAHRSRVRNGTIVFGLRPFAAAYKLMLKG